MFKIFMGSCIVYLIALIIYTYFIDEGQEHEDNVGYVFLIGVIYVSLGMILLVMQPEIKSLVSSMRDVSTVKVIESKKFVSSYVEGYLKKNSPWVDKLGIWRFSSENTRIEIWQQKIIMSGGGEMTQIFFLEGENAGFWGYTTEEFLLYDKP